MAANRTVAHPDQGLVSKKLASLEKVQTIDMRSMWRVGKLVVRTRRDT